MSDVAIRTPRLRPPTVGPVAVDALRSCPDGRYDDGWVTVLRSVVPGITAERGPAGRIVVGHRFRPSQLDDEIGAQLAAALAPLTGDHEVFVRAFTGIVLTSNPYALDAWGLFYRNSLARIRHRSSPGYSDVYRHAIGLLPATSVVDLGCSFGFLGLHLAERGVAVTACDVDAGTTALVRRMSRRLGRPLEVRTTSQEHVDLPDGAADAVALVHVLEHMSAADADTLVGEALRVARHRVVVAVPYESVASALYGHLRCLTAADLRALGAASGVEYDVHDHLGGWLVLDKPPAEDSGHPAG